MNKKKDWQAGLGIKSHKPFCKRPSGGLSCPSSGHSVNKRRASTEQATGIDWTSVGHRLNKRRALIARAVFTECPKVRRFLGTPYGLAALLLCIMPHDDFVILRWRFFMILLSDWWYFYDTSCKIIRNVSFFYLIIYQLFTSTFCQRMILWHFFHKKLFSYEHILNCKSKKYLIWNLIDTKKYITM